MKFLLPFAIVSLLLVQCKNVDPLGQYQDLDLMSHGLPIKIKAPDGVKVVVDDLGFAQDVTIKNDENFYIQLASGTATTTNIANIKAEYITTVKNSKYFSKIVEEEEAGFIYEKDLGDENINYDFRYIRVQGDKEYVFQRGLVGTYTLEQVRTMYNAVK